MFPLIMRLRILKTDDVTSLFIYRTMRLFVGCWHVFVFIERIHVRACLCKIIFKKTTFTKPYRMVLLELL